VQLYCATKSQVCHGVSRNFSTVAQLFFRLEQRSILCNFVATLSNNLWKLTCLATEAHSGSIEFICAIQKALMYVCMYVCMWWTLIGQFLFMRQSCSVRHAMSHFRFCRAIKMQVWHRSESKLWTHRPWLGDESRSLGRWRCCRSLRLQFEVDFSTSRPMTFFVSLWTPAKRIHSMRITDVTNACKILNKS